MHKEIAQGTVIAADFCSLPTTGVTITQVEKVQDDTSGKTGTFTRITGVIHPVDPEASNIMFQLGIPQQWNKRLIQLGGGGLDGLLLPVESPYMYHGRSAEAATPLKDGYAVCLCDGGHQSVDLSNPSDISNLWKADWARNEETLRNFALDAQKKTHDAAVAVLELLHHNQPEKTYYYGGSNGGRECLLSLEHYPEDYDGAICFFPVLHWTLKILADSRNGHMARQLGENAWIPPESSFRYAMLYGGTAMALTS